MLSFAGTSFQGQRFQHCSKGGQWQALALMTACTTLWAATHEPHSVLQIGVLVDQRVSVCAASCRRVEALISAIVGFDSLTSTAALRVGLVELKAAVGAVTSFIVQAAPSRLYTTMNPAFERPLSHCADSF